MARDGFKYIAVEGVIGAGKTTLAGKLSRWYGAHFIAESFEENPFLAHFYNDIERYAFQTQIFFLLNRFKQQKQLRQFDLFHSRIISDYIFQKDRIFASMNLSAAEMKLYDALAKIMEQDIVTPDLVLYLKSSTHRLLKNIRLRNRIFESSISKEYIDTLNSNYESFFSKFNSAPVLVLEMENYDIIDNREDFSKITALISQSLKENILNVS
jgi:deoxyadenosine/deoxycytidine kinase